MAEQQPVDQRPLDGVVTSGTEPVKAPEGTQAEKHEEAPQIDEVEARAREQGWVSKDEWQGDPAAWRPANIFVDRGELLGKIKSQSSKMRELEGMVNYLAEQNRKLYEAGYEKAVDELTAARDAAIEAGDAKAVRDLEKQLRAHEKELEKAKQPAPKASATPVVDDLYQEWSARNPWYTKDEVLQDWANGAAVKMKTKNGNITEAEIYKQLEVDVRKVFPEKFKRVGAPSPDGASNRGAGSPARKDGNSDFDALLAELPEDEAQIARNLVKRGHVTKEQFMQDFKLVNGRR
jgi:hypothetical protein